MFRFSFRRDGGTTTGVSICSLVFAEYEAVYHVNDETKSDSCFKVWIGISPRHATPKTVRRPVRLLVVGKATYVEGEMVGGIRVPKPISGDEKPLTTPPCVI